jgi:hypothetical protein
VAQAGSWGLNGAQGYECIPTERTQEEEVAPEPNPQQFQVFVSFCLAGCRVVIEGLLPCHDTGKQMYIRDMCKMQIPPNVGILTATDSYSCSIVCYVPLRVSSEAREVLYPEST